MTSTAPAQYSAIQPRNQSAIAMRVLQGLALGGEYGGAATYIAEHAPDGKRGVYTSWIQIFASAFGTVFEWHDFIFTRRWHRVAARRRSLENKVLK
jgi:MFS family permease